MEPLIGPGRPRAGRRRLAAVSRLGLAAIIATTTILSATSSAAAVTVVPDPDGNSTDVTGWIWQTNATPAQIGAAASAGYRIVDLDVTSSAPTFTVAYVANSGTYGRGWWWYYNLTAADVGSTLSANNARPIDIEPYNTASGLRFAVVMVSNTGVAGKAYWWYYNQTAASIGSLVSAYNARIVDIDRYATASGDRFNVILIPNTGVDGVAWWYYFGLTPSAIGTALATNHARLTNIERTDAGTYDVVMVSAGPQDIWWLYGQTASQLGNAASQLGARIYGLESYVVNSTRYFTAMLINDVDPETTRIRDLVSSQMSGSWGFYVKKIGGNEVVGLQEDRVFEPASMIKIIHAVTALRETQSNNGTTLQTPITWYANPAEPARYPNNPNYASSDGTFDAPNVPDPADKDVCAYDSSGTLLTGATYSDPMALIINQMLGYSDNRTTDALTRRYGFAALNATAALAGMTKSHVNHRPGCPKASSPQPYQHNELTLRDAGRIYEGAEDGTLLSQYNTNVLNNLLVGGTLSPNTPLGAMITAEAKAAGLTSAEISSFIYGTTVRSKGGSYGLCPDSGACNPPTVQDRTVGGTIWLPFKDGLGNVVSTPFVFGQFFNQQVNCSFASVTAKTCTAFNNEAAGNSTVAVEMFRSIVKQAISTW
jgi:hypothetical protein